MVAHEHSAPPISLAESGLPATTVVTPIQATAAAPGAPTLHRTETTLRTTHTYRVDSNVSSFHDQGRVDARDMFQHEAGVSLAEDAGNSDKPAAQIKRVPNIAWTAETYEELLRCWADSPAPILGLDTYSFTDIAGRPIAAGAAFADSLVQAIRQVVPNAARVTINMTAGTRFFTGLARLGGQLRLRVLLAQLPCTDPPLERTRLHRGPPTRRHHRHRHSERRHRRLTQRVRAWPVERELMPSTLRAR